jgi:hypothetical protein
LVENQQKKRIWRAGFSRRKTDRKSITFGVALDERSEQLFERPSQIRVFLTALSNRL